MIAQVKPTNAVDVAQEGRKQGRSMSEKVGRLKYNQFLLKRVLTELKEIRDVQRIILGGLKGAGYFHFDVPLIEKFACIDEVDLEILDRVHMARRDGILPKDVAADLPEYHLKHYHVSRRIQRMNKRLEHETGERLFEKRGLKWALTHFGFEVWGETQSGMDGELEKEKEGRGAR